MKATILKRIHDLILQSNNIEMYEKKWLTDIVNAELELKRQSEIKKKLYALEKKFNGVTIK